MTTYTYPLSDFTAVVGNIDVGWLRRQISASSISKSLQAGKAGLCFIQDNTAPDPNYQFDFDGALSAGEETTLDGLVAAHIGPYPWGTDQQLGSQRPFQVYLHNYATLEAGKLYIPWFGDDAEAALESFLQYFLGPIHSLIRVELWSLDSATGVTTVGLHIDGEETPQASKQLTLGSTMTTYMFDFTSLSNLTVGAQSVALSVDVEFAPGTIVVRSIWDRMPGV